MTPEQVKELAEALSILSARSSVLKERTELRALMEENLSAEEVRTFEGVSLRRSSPLLLGPAIAFRGAHQAYPYHAHQD